jgi:hypothetical protein
LLEIEIETLKNTCSKELESGAIRANARAAERLTKGDLRRTAESPSQPRSSGSKRERAGSTNSFPLWRVKPTGRTD